jgi:RNA polymerase sigma-70 factor (ECF subfamily)
MTIGLRGSTAARQGISTAGRRDSGLEMTTETFEQLFERYQTKIFNLIYRIVGDYEDAADLTSEAFVQAFKGFDRFRGESQVYTWLYRIAINTCRNHFRRLGRRRRVPSQPFEGLTPDELAEIQQTPDWAPSPEEALEAGELRREIMEGIAALPDDFRMVIVLRDLQGLSYQEMAEVLGCSLEAVKSRLFRARRTLSKRLEAYLSAEA